MIISLISILTIIDFLQIIQRLFFSKNFTKFQFFLKNEKEIIESFNLLNNITIEGIINKTFF